MLIIPPPLSHSRRKPRPKPQPAALAVVSIEVESVTSMHLELLLMLDVNIGFALTDLGSADPAQWVARYGDKRFTGFELDPVGTAQIFLTLENPIDNAGADVLSYSGAPADILDTQGRRLKAFADWPL